MTTDALDELAGALAKFQAEVPVIPKKQTARIETQGGRAYTYTYADLASIAPVVMPLLAKHGLAFTAMPTAGEGAPLLVGMLVHTSGQWITGELPITGRTPQEIGSSLTYGRRYLLGCLTGVVTDDDDDGELATKAARARPRQPAAPVAPQVPTPAIQRTTRPRPVGSAPGEAAPRESPHGPPGAQAPDDVPPGTDPGSEATSEPRDPTDQQIRAMFAAVGKALGPHAQRVERLALCSAIIGRPVQSSTDLNRSEVGVILDWLDAMSRGVVTWTYDPSREVGRVHRVVVEEPPPNAEDVPLPDPSDPWVSHEHGDET